MKNTLIRRIGSLVGIGAVVLTAFADSATAASTSTDATNIPAELSSLTITKYDFGSSGAASDLSHNGTEVTVPTTYKKLNGVKFKVSEVKYDGDVINLNTQDGWDRAKGLFNTDGTVKWNGEAPALPTGFSVEEVSTRTTSDGVAKWTNLEHRVYLVEELEASDTDVITSSDGKEITVQNPAAPFLVTLPLANNGANTDSTEKWINDVFVYPKNNTIDSKGTKTAELDNDYINNLDATDQTTVTWTVTARTPVKMEALDGISLEDTLPAGITLAMKEDGRTPDVSVTIDGLDKTSAFTISGNVNFALKGSDQAGRLNALRIDAPSAIQGKEVVFTFKVTVDPDQFTSTKMTNTATVTINGTPVIASTGDGNGSEPGDGNDSTPLFAKVTLTKKDAKDNSVLQGVEFTIYEATETTGTPATPNTDAPIGTFTTNAEGKLDVSVYLGTIAKAHATNSEVNTAAEVTKNVCIVETKALVGYDKESFTTQCFTLTGEGIEKALGEVTNIKTGDKWTAGLPLTGAQGLVVLSIGGVVLLAAGIFAIAAVRRRQKQD